MDMRLCPHCREFHAQVEPCETSKLSEAWERLSDVAIKEADAREREVYRAFAAQQRRWRYGT